MIRGLVFAVSAVLVLGVAGCDEDTDSSGTDGVGGAGSTSTETVTTAQHTPACDLIPQAQLEALVGNPLSPPADNSAAKHVCMWDAPDFETQRSLTIQLFHNGANDYDATRAYVEEKYGAATDVPGVGDKAYYLHYVQEVGGFTSSVAQMGATQDKDLVAVTVGGLTLDAATGEAVTKSILTQVLLKID
jgi:hypothetical protein